MQLSQVGPDLHYAVDLLRVNIGKNVLVVLNFSGQQPPERRTFGGKIRAVGADYFLLEVSRTDNRLLVFFVNLAYLSFDRDMPNLIESIPTQPLQVPGYPDMAPPSQYGGQQTQSPPFPASPYYQAPNYPWQGN